MISIAEWCKTLRECKDLSLKEYRARAMRQYNQKWRENNRDKYNAYHRAYYKKRMDDPKYREQRRAYQQEYYHKRKSVTNEVGI